MSAAPAISDEASAALTRARRELKYLIPKTRLSDLTRTVSQHLPLHLLGNATDSTPPLSDQAVTTVYFDTEERDLFRAADGTEHNIKHEREGGGYDEIVWLELKLRNGDQTSKRRVALPKPDVQSFLETGSRSPAMGVIARAVPGTDEILDELFSFVRDFGKALRPACIVNYVRCAWQATDGSVRVTIDRDVAFFPASLNQWRRQDLTERKSLGPPAGTEPSCVIEIKTHGEPPAWLDAALASCEARRVDYSKFVSAMRALYRL
jgi:SPX domain protein involved in polyphosphate accumulation